MMFSRETNPGLGRSGSVRPQLEALEDRCCPSGVTFQNHILQVTGDAAKASTVAIQDDGHGDVKVTLNGHLTSVSSVQQIQVNSLGGSDAINYTLTNPLTTSEVLKLNLGTSRDQVKLDYSKGVSAPSLKILLNGGSGDQNVSAVFGSITNTDLQLAANLGNGWDHFSAQLNGNLAGIAKVDVNVKGGTHTDGVTVQTHGNIAKTAQLSVEAVLGTSFNTSRVDYTGKLDGKLSIQETGGPSWDWIESTVNLTAGSTGSLFDHELGGASSDLLMLMVNAKGSTLKSLDALIDGGTGSNTAVNTANVKVLNAHH